MDFGAVNKFLLKLFGSKNERVLRQLMPAVEAVNNLEPTVKAMSDGELAQQTQKLIVRYQSGEFLDDLLPEAFATVREATLRTLGMRHFDVQLMGGMVLHQGNIAEMKTGEGKTLVAPLAAYLNALTGRGVHIITVNDYLARRDSEWMGQIFRFLGLKVGVIVHGLNDHERKTAYSADIIYGTNNEFGFDYLRDNMKFEKNLLVQRDLHFAIVDEVDSILVDEARTPLIISGPAEKSTDLYYQVNNIIPSLQQEDHYTIDEKARSVALTEDGVARVEKLMAVDNLYDPKCIDLLHHVNQALKAHTMFKRDVDYIVKEGQVIIVDEFTGRLMPGRRYSEGLHQALEAKEKVKIENENQTLATITFQNYFRMYDKLAGMTGTAETEAAEFNKIYKLDVVVIPTNQPMIRVDYPDVIYQTRREKFNAVLDEIAALNAKGQPVLVGTVSIDVSEDVSLKLKKRGIPHTVLNAKNHEAEAEIIANAGQKGAVTISTNMAGRGTDIVLGEGVVALGGLHVLGTERHESRRIDNQLRGRSGRQGDPGSSRFYLSLEDDLLRIFGGERISSIMSRLGMEEGEPIEHRMISKAIENAQTKVEAHNFDIRKQLIDFDDVMNQQREVVYRQRRQALSGESLKPGIEEWIMEKTEYIVDAYGDDKLPVREWDLKGLADAVFHQFNFRIAIDGFDDSLDSPEKIIQHIQETALARYNEKEAGIGADHFRNIERILMLQIVDNLWKDHLLSMDHLREGIGLRGYAQQDPIRAYKKEAFEMFQELVFRIREETLRILFRIQLAEPEAVATLERPRQQQLSFSHGGPPPRKQPVRVADKVGRNDPCPCGSGKKYKKCCGK
ncbi:MAG: preprotein translocase subunit SecA [Desulfobacteraceae bacterium]|jgi:preprotein translocase subunit SecA|nr:MAG: preprotein translocase subunit SecA [Desulfobacteraceae bacterium]